MGITGKRGLNHLQELNLPVDDCKGQAYDGAGSILCKGCPCWITVQMCFLGVLMSPDIGRNSLLHTGRCLITF